MGGAPTTARYAAERFPDRRLVLVGHSLGGAAAVLAAAMGAPVDGIVTIAAPANVLEVTADYLRDKGFQPVLVLQPEDDRRVDRRHAHRLAEAAGVTACVIPGAGHTSVLAHPETYARILTFVSDLGVRQENPAV